MNPRLVVVTLTEDTGRDAVATTHALAKSALKLLDPATRTHLIKFEPYDVAHRPVVKANMWMSTAGRDQRSITELNKYLARLVKQGPPLHVVVHFFDADAAAGSPEAVAKDERWRTAVAAVVARLAGPDAAARLVAFVACPELEGWLYLHTERLAALAERDGVAPPVPPPGGWDTCAGVKDEHPWPKDAHNLALATSFPAGQAAAASPSFAAAVARLGAVPGIREALAGTYV